MELAIGVDIGGTNTKVGLVDKMGTSYGELRFKTQIGHNTFDDFVETLSQNILKIIRGEKDAKIKGIGIGAPNGNFYKGTIEYAPNLKWKGKLNLVEKLKEKTGIQNILITNDANAAAIGEMTFGSAKKLKDFVVITLGTGLGSGIVISGNLLLGHDGFAGEIGHVTAVDGGRKCGCGKCGCLETYVSATGINRTVFELLSTEYLDSILRGIAYNDLTSKQISEAAEKDDEIAKMAFEITGWYLGKELANTVAHLSPEAIIIFGGLANAGDILLEPIKRHMEENLMPIYKDKVEIMLSGLNTGVNAAVLGASALIWKGIKY